MARPRRIDVGGVVYHALNRGAGRARLFASAADFSAFERIVVQARERIPMRVLAHCLMPNHWHFVLWPRVDGDLSRFLRWLTQTHAQRLHRARGTVGSGPVYQGRYKSFPVQTDPHFLTVCRYVERNPLRAGLLSRAEQWQWSSLWHRLNPSRVEHRFVCRAWPVERPDEWVDWVNQPLSDAELRAVRGSVRRGSPLGNHGWVRQTAEALGLTSTLRHRGRPRRT